MNQKSSVVYQTNSGCKDKNSLNKNKNNFPYPFHSRGMTYDLALSL